MQFSAVVFYRASLFAMVCLLCICKAVSAQDATAQASSLQGAPKLAELGDAGNQDMTAELVFPLRKEHNHAPGIVELPNGELLVSWYRGSGERTADDVAVYGARLQKNSPEWSPAFLMADRPEFPDCNTAMIVDDQKRLWLFWPTIIANSWESALTNFRVSSDYQGPGQPIWEREGVILLKPDDFSAEANSILDEMLAGREAELSERQRNGIVEMRERLSDRLFQRLGWQPRCKPTILPSGRILLPLYSDTFSISIMAVSDDQGETWYASRPLIGFGNIQPAVLRRTNGTLMAYMRENGPQNKIRVCESQDDGLTWGRVGTLDLPNPGSGLDGMRLQNGHWLLVYNDTVEGRSSLAVSISTDEGYHWNSTRHLEQRASGAFHYPAVTQGSDDRIHVVYSYFVENGKSMKHVAFTEAWVTAGEG